MATWFELGDAFVLEELEQGLSCVTLFNVPSASSPSYPLSYDSSIQDWYDRKLLDATVDNLNNEVLIKERDHEHKQNTR